MFSFFHKQDYSNVTSCSFHSKWQSKSCNPTTNSTKRNSTSSSKETSRWRRAQDKNLSRGYQTRDGKMWSNYPQLRPMCSAHCVTILNATKRYGNRYIFYSLYESEICSSFLFTDIFTQERSYQWESWFACETPSNERYKISSD